ncbi:hypothetical protein MA16_Dca005085 [Dendrobium catenatum]|uniref:Uncharacterized protein n=1 Tax=Dendrobium catenatum TaxID=906689 RepID=A0A2I0WGU9_9ASPA|nr:hypothetical protein MA16_Dca005085 [Dendrobium catenatum]
MSKSPLVKENGDGLSLLNSIQRVQNPLMKHKGALVIKEVLETSPMVVKHVEGKVKAVVDMVDMITPNNGVKVFDDLPKLVNSGMNNPWSKKPYIKLDFKDDEIASGDDSPRKSFASKFRQKKFTVSKATQPDEGEGPSVPPADVADPSTGPHLPYPYPYYYPYLVQDEQGGPSRPPEVGTSNHAAVTDKRQYIELEGDKIENQRKKEQEEQPSPNSPPAADRMHDSRCNHWHAIGEVTTS